MLYIMMLPRAPTTRRGVGVLVIPAAAAAVAHASQQQPKQHQLWALWVTNDLPLPPPSVLYIIVYTQTNTRTHKHYTRAIRRLLRTIYPTTLTLRARDLPLGYLPILLLLLLLRAGENRFWKRNDDKIMSDDISLTTQMRSADVCSRKIFVETQLNRMSSAAAAA